jgi:hypothetical protein
MSIRKRGARSYQVRVEPFAAKTFPTKASARAYELELLTRRGAGRPLCGRPAHSGG